MRATKDLSTESARLIGISPFYGTVVTTKRDELPRYDDVKFLQKKLSPKRAEGDLEKAVKLRKTKRYQKKVFELSEGSVLNDEGELEVVKTSVDLATVRSRDRKPLCERTERSKELRDMLRTHFEVKETPVYLQDRTIGGNPAHIAFQDYAARYKGFKKEVRIHDQSVDLLYDDGTGLILVEVTSNASAAKIEKFKTNSAIVKNDKCYLVAVSSPHGSSEETVQSIKSIFFYDAMTKNLVQVNEVATLVVNEEFKVPKYVETVTRTVKHKAQPDGDERPALTTNANAMKLNQLAKLMSQRVNRINLNIDNGFDDKILEKMKDLCDGDDELFEEASELFFELGAVEKGSMSILNYEISETTVKDGLLAVCPKTDDMIGVQCPLGDVAQTHTCSTKYAIGPGDGIPISHVVTENDRSMHRTTPDAMKVYNSSIDAMRMLADVGSNETIAREVIDTSMMGMHALSTMKVIVNAVFAATINSNSDEKDSVSSVLLALANKGDDDGTNPKIDSLPIGFSATLGFICKLRTADEGDVWSFSMIIIGYIPKFMRIRNVKADEIREEEKQFAVSRLRVDNKKVLEARRDYLADTHITALEKSAKTAQSGVKNIDSVLRARLCQRVIDNADMDITQKAVELSLLCIKPNTLYLPSNNILTGAVKLYKTGGVRTRDKEEFTPSTRTIFREMNRDENQITAIKVDPIMRMFKKKLSDHSEREQIKRAAGAKTQRYGYHFEGHESAVFSNEESYKTEVLKVLDGTINLAESFVSDARRGFVKNTVTDAAAVTMGMGMTTRAITIRSVQSRKPVFGMIWANGRWLLYRGGKTPSVLTGFKMSALTEIALKKQRDRNEESLGQDSESSNKSSRISLGRRAAVGQSHQTSQPASSASGDHSSIKSKPISSSNDTDVGPIEDFTHDIDLDSVSTVVEDEAITGVITTTLLPSEKVAVLAGEEHTISCLVMLTKEYTDRLSSSGMRLSSFRATTTLHSSVNWEALVLFAQSHRADTEAMELLYLVMKNGLSDLGKLQEELRSNAETMAQKPSTSLIFGVCCLQYNHMRDLHAQTQLELAVREEEVSKSSDSIRLTATQKLSMFWLKEEVVAQRELVNICALQIMCGSKFRQPGALCDGTIKKTNKEQMIRTARDVVIQSLERTKLNVSATKGKILDHLVPYVQPFCGTLESAALTHSTLKKGVSINMLDSAFASYLSQPLNTLFKSGGVVANQKFGNGSSAHVSRHILLQVESFKKLFIEYMKEELKSVDVESKDGNGQMGIDEWLAEQTFGFASRKPIIYDVLMAGLNKLSEGSEDPWCSPLMYASMKLQRVAFRLIYTLSVIGIMMFSSDKEMIPIIKQLVGTSQMWPHELTTNGPQVETCLKLIFVKATEAFNGTLKKQPFPMADPEDMFDNEVLEQLPSYLHSVDILGEMIELSLEENSRLIVMDFISIRRDHSAFSPAGRDEHQSAMLHTNSVKYQFMEFIREHTELILPANWNNQIDELFCEITGTIECNKGDCYTTKFGEFWPQGYVSTKTSLHVLCCYQLFDAFINHTGIGRNVTVNNSDDHMSFLIFNKGISNARKLGTMALSLSGNDSFKTSPKKSGAGGPVSEIVFHTGTHEFADIPVGAVYSGQKTLRKKTIVQGTDRDSSSHGFSMAKSTNSAVNVLQSLTVMSSPSVIEVTLKSALISSLAHGASVNEFWTNVDPVLMYLDQCGHKEIFNSFIDIIKSHSPNFHRTHDEKPLSAWQTKENQDLIAHVIGARKTLPPCVGGHINPWTKGKDSDILYRSLKDSAKGHDKTCWDMISMICERFSSTPSTLSQRFDTKRGMKNQLLPWKSAFKSAGVFVDDERMSNQTSANIPFLGTNSESISMTAFDAAPDIRSYSLRVAHALKKMEKCESMGATKFDTWNCDETTYKQTLQLINKDLSNVSETKPVLDGRTVFAESTGLIGSTASSRFGTTMSLIFENYPETKTIGDLVRNAWKVRHTHGLLLMNLPGAKEFIHPELDKRSLEYWSHAKNTIEDRFRESETEERAHCKVINSLYPICEIRTGTNPDGTNSSNSKTGIRFNRLFAFGEAVAVASLLRHYADLVDTYRNVNAGRIYKSALFPSFISATRDNVSLADSFSPLGMESGRQSLTGKPYLNIALAAAEVTQRRLTLMASTGTSITKEKVIDIYSEEMQTQETATLNSLALGSTKIHIQENRANFVVLGKNGHSFSNRRPLDPCYLVLPIHFTMCWTFNASIDKGEETLKVFSKLLTVLAVIGLAGDPDGGTFLEGKARVVNGRIVCYAVKISGKRDDDTKSLASAHTVMEPTPVGAGATKSHSLSVFLTHFSDKKMDIVPNSAINQEPPSIWNVIRLLASLSSGINRTSTGYLATVAHLHLKKKTTTGLFRTTSDIVIMITLRNMWALERIAKMKIDGTGTDRPAIEIFSERPPTLISSLKDTSDFGSYQIKSVKFFNSANPEKKGAFSSASAMRNVYFQVKEKLGGNHPLLKLISDARMLNKSRHLADMSNKCGDVAAHMMWLMIKQQSRGEILKEPLVLSKGGFHTFENKNCKIPGSSAYDSFTRSRTLKLGTGVPNTYTKKGVKVYQNFAFDAPVSGNTAFLIRKKDERKTVKELLTDLARNDGPEYTLEMCTTGLMVLSPDLAESMIEGLNLIPCDLSGTGALVTASENDVGQIEESDLLDDRYEE